MEATEKIAVLTDVCVCMYVRVLRVHVWFSPHNHDRARACANINLLILTTIFDWKWSSTLRSRFPMVDDLLAVESTKLSSLTYIITKLISLVIKVVNEIIMIRLLFIIYYAASLFMPFMF